MDWWVSLRSPACNVWWARKRSEFGRGWLRLRFAGGSVVVGTDDGDGDEDDGDYCDEDDDGC